MTQLYYRTLAATEAADRALRARKKDPNKVGNGQLYATEFRRAMEATAPHYRNEELWRHIRMIAGDRYHPVADELNRLHRVGIRGIG